MIPDDWRPDDNMTAEEWARESYDATHEEDEPCDDRASCKTQTPSGRAGSARPRC